MVNQLLYWVEANGLNQPLYDIFFAGSGVVLMIFCCFNAKNYKLPLKKAIPFLAIGYTIVVAWMFFLYWAESGFRRFGGNNTVRIFVWIPLFTWILCKFFKLDFKTMCDYQAPNICFNHGIGHLGCVFGGCCYSYPWESGVYNHVLEYKTFPIQPIEALVSLGIALFIWRLENKNGFKVNGRYYPLMMILFGYSRFLLEFARDNDKLFLGISNLAIHALFTGIVGTIWYYQLRKKGS